MSRSSKEYDAAGRRMGDAALNVEYGDGLDELRAGALRMTAGAGLLAAAILLFLAAVNRGLTLLLADAVGADIASWLSPLILTAAVGALAWLVVRGVTDGFRGGSAV